MAEEEKGIDGPVDPRIFFAAERTLLAWVRTGLAMMSFGFVVARFGLFLREMASIPEHVGPKTTGFSIAAGTFLVLLGVAVTVGSALKYWSTMRRLERGEFLRARFWSMEMVLAFVLGILGLAMAAYLVFGLGAAK